MPAPYRCPKGGSHDRVKRGAAVVCKKCGLTLLLLREPVIPRQAPRRPVPRT